MPNTRMIRSVISEYGIGWASIRFLYSAKLKSMALVPPTEKLYEKKTAYPKRLDLFDIDICALQMFIHGLTNEEKEQLIKTADNVCEGIIKGFSSIELNFGNPIDWQLSPLTGKRCDEKQKWYRIPDFDKERGDIKVIWEASRFSHFLTLSRAYLLTEDKKYYTAFSLQLKDWLEKNSYSLGANYKCSQECSLRMVNALLAYTVFRKSGIATDADDSNVKDLVDRCYRKILSNFFYAYRCIKNNHTISELMGMIVGSWCCDDPKQMEKAYDLLNEVIDEQFTSDGGYRQFSFNYQRLALQDIEVVISVEGKTGRRISEESRIKVKNSAWLMYQCQDDSFDMPNYGNNDGALVFPVTACGYRDFRPVINTAYALTTGTQLFNEGKHQEELIWFSGGKRLDEYEICTQQRESSQFADAGLFTLRGRKSWAMVVSNNYSSRPGHMDQQHIDIWVDGVNVLCDAGTYSYASEEGRALVRNDSHNTVVVDRAFQMNASGPFMIYDWTKRVLRNCDGNRYSGKTISANGYEHIREVKQIGASYEITDTCNKDFRVFFHTPCIIEKKDKGFELKHNGRVLCTVECMNKSTLSKGNRSLYYLRKDVTACLIIEGHEGTDIKTIVKIAEGE